MPARIPVITPESALNPEQRRVLAGLLDRRGGRIPGPYRFTLHCPEITELMHPFGELLRLRSSFPLRVSEMAIVSTARAWDSDYIFTSHSAGALKAGVELPVIEAMQRGERPVFRQADEEAVYDFTTELCVNHKISDATYQRVLNMYDVPRAVELSSLIGYYSLVAATILAHEMPLPEDARRLSPRRK
jgi:4-carboxymuconolactone decarboxylase